MKKRITVLLMVSILALTMTAGVYAAGQSTTITALYQEPAISVYVPSAEEMILNPKGYPMTVAGKVQFAQIINMPWTIENRSEVAVTVDAKVTGKVAAGSKMTLASRSVAGSTSTAKQAFMFLNMKVMNPDDELLTEDWFNTTYDAKKHIVVGTSGVTRQDIMLLAPANEDGTTAEGGVGAFHIYGDATPTPAEEWNPKVDKVDVSVAFTFRPAVMPEEEPGA